MERPVLVVTGASSGIGEATALRFARAGYRVVLAARREERLQAVAQQVRQAGGEPLVVRTDVSDVEQIRRLAQRTLETFGQVDVLFNNAGFGRLKWLEALDPYRDVEAQVKVDLLGVIWTTQAFLPAMIARRRGHIINMGSVASLVATPTYSVYAAAKFGVRGFTEALRREVGIYGLKVSLICPGGVTTEFGQHTQAHRHTRITTPKWLALSADDVAQVVWRLVQRPRRMVIIPPLMRAVVWLNRWFPGLVDAVIEARFTRREREREG